MLRGIRGVGILALLVIIVSQCSKEDPVRTYRIEEETSQWTAFKPGSYWIFQLASDRSVTDSIYVSSYKEKMISGYDDHGNKSKSQKIEVGYSFGKGSYLAIIENILPRGNSLKIEAFDLRSVKTSSLDLMLIFPLNFINNNDNEYFSIISSNDNLSIGRDVIISDVVHVKCRVKGHSGVVANQTYFNEYWISRNRWIVKMIVRNPETGADEEWNLLRYKIVQ